MRRTLTLVFAAGAMLASAGGTALAEPSSGQGRGQAQGRALDLFEQSAKAYRDGRFQDAVDLLLEARKVKPEPVLLYNLGRAYEALGKPTEAADAYEQYLREDPRAADRKAIEGRVATLRAQAAELEKARTAPPAGATTNDDRRDRGSEPTTPPKEDSPTIVPWIVAGSVVTAVGLGWLGVRAFSASPAPSSARGVRIVPGLGSLVLGGRF